jgi:hypothetical protein
MRGLPYAQIILVSCFRVNSPSLLNGGLLEMGQKQSYSLSEASGNEGALDGEVAQTVNTGKSSKVLKTKSTFRRTNPRENGVIPKSD